VYSTLLDLQPGFDFSYGCDSLAISGHKFIGSPIPCGLVLVKKSYRDRIGKVIPYIGTADTTISGSRNGHSPLFLWYAIKKHGTKGLTRRAMVSLETAAYAVRRLRQAGIEAWRNKDALTVVFPELPEKLRTRWQLATENGYSHIICMPGVTKEKIDQFADEIEEYEKEGPAKAGPGGSHEKTKKKDYWECSNGLISFNPVWG
jgi:histidine decarboxylase